MICIPILAKNTEEALVKITRANPIADILEFRLDVMDSYRIADMIQIASKPVMVTYRSAREGGKSSVSHETRTRCLLDAVEHGADFVDVEYSMPLESRRRVVEKLGSRVIISIHLVNDTPPNETLEDILKNLAGTGAHIVKIVTRAREPMDNLRVLGLIPRAQKLGVRIISFCMGPLGRLSRIVSPLLGAYLTFASLGAGEESADGQIPAVEMKKMLEILKP
jgi:3-dehydroquinate dehydratase type I